MSDSNREVRLATERTVTKAPEELPNNCFPSGFVYAPNVFSPEEQARIIEIIDQHEFSHLIHRRQQFYGTVYYQTTTHNSSLQPGEDIQPEETQYCHDIAPLQWVVDRLVEKGLFVEADPDEPLAEFISSEEAKVLYPNEDLKHNEVHLRKIPCEEDVNVRFSSDEVRFAPHHRSYPTQILVNEYIEKQGIGNHYDDPRAFGPIILGISLGSAAKLTLTLPGCINRARTIKAPLAYCLSSSEQEFESKGSCKGICESKCEGKMGSLECTTNIEDLMYNPTTTSLRGYVGEDWSPLPDNMAPASLGRVCACLREEWTMRVWEIAAMRMADRRGVRRELRGPKVATEVIAQKTQKTQQADSLNVPKNKIINAMLKNATKNASINALQKLLSEHENKRDVCEEVVSSVFKVPAYIIALKAADEAYAGATAALGSEKRRNVQSSKAKKAHGGGMNKLPQPEPLDMKWLQKLAKSRTQSAFKSSLFNGAPSIDCTDENGCVVAWAPPSLSSVNKCRHPTHTVDVNVEPGSVYILAGDARYRWRHGIKKVPSQRDEGFRRISLTVRSLMPGRRRVQSKQQ